MLNRVAAKNFSGHLLGRIWQVKSKFYEAAIAPQSRIELASTTATGNKPLRGTVSSLPLYLLGSGGLRSLVFHG